MIPEYIDKYINRTETHWLWMGTIDTTGYGVFYYEGKKHGAHRLVRHFLLDFNLESEMSILHKRECHTRECVNPDHTYEGDQSDNIMDTVYNNTHHNANKTHCPKGHAYDLSNTIYQKDHHVIGRKCRKCVNKNKLEYYYKKVREKKRLALEKSLNAKNGNGTGNE